MNLVKTMAGVLAGAAIGFSMLLAVPQVAPSDAYADLVKISTAFDNASSWHAEEHFSNGRTNIVDYQAPDRWRLIEDSKTEILIIGKDVYMISNGKASKMPFGGGLFQRIVKTSWAKDINSPEVRASAQDLGMQTIDGQSLHAYSFVAHHVPETLYVGSDWLPVEAVVHSKKLITTNIYSKYNQPANIAVP